MAMLYVSRLRASMLAAYKKMEKNGARLHFLDVIKNGEGTRGSKRGTLGPSTGEYRASIKKVSYRWQTKA